MCFKCSKKHVYNTSTTMLVQGNYIRIIPSHTGQLYCLQARPIVTLPPSPFFSPAVPGAAATLWDNSNIVESFAGVTSPLTFSFASLAYREVGAACTHTQSQ